MTVKFKKQSKTDEYLTPEQVADLYQVNLETIRRKIRRGELPAIRLGRLWRVPVGELHEFEKTKLTGVASAQRGIVQ